jgi:hypothetical protein
VCSQALQGDVKNMRNNIRNTQKREDIRGIVVGLVHERELAIVNKDYEREYWINIELMTL